MGLSVYFMLGVMLLIAVRNPEAFRSLIAFAAWSSFAHAAVMLVMVVHDARSRGEWLMVVVLSVIGGALIALAPRKQSAEDALQSQ